MEREKGSVGLTVEVDGKVGIVVEHAADTLEVKVRFQDGTERWVAVDQAREKAAAKTTLPRELGS